ncbi:MAG: hypothetical protein RMK43_01110 [Cyclobacteriaceae bacterium]|nr:hypothetical protein [Cyclobacteriaceae bacterium]
MDKVVILYSCKSSSEKQDQAQADAIYYGGDMITMEGEQPEYVEVVAVQNGNIAFAGSLQEALKLQGKSTVMVDLKG